MKNSNIIMPGAEFIPGKTLVPASGKIFDREEIDNVIKAAEAGIWTEHEFADEFTGAMEEFLGAKYALLTNSGSSANLLALYALSSERYLGDRAIQPGDELITTAVAFPTTVNPGLQFGLKPVFVEFDEKTFNINLDLIEEAITPKTKVIMFAYTLGLPVDMDRLVEIVKKHNLLFIGDACDAFGSKWNGKNVTDYADISTTSFYPAHIITTAEGGALFTNNSKLKMAIESFRNWGRDCWCGPGQDNTCGKRFAWKDMGELPDGYDHKNTYSHIGFNLKMTEFQAALGAAQMKKLPGFIAKRRENYCHLYEFFQQYGEFIDLPVIHPKAEPSHFGFPMLVKDDAPFTRNEFAGYLEDNRIGTRNMFAGNILRQPGYTKIDKRVVGGTDISDRFMRNCFWIGVYPGIDDQRISYVKDMVSQFMRKYR